MRLIEKVSQQPSVLKEFSVQEMEALAAEIRQVIIETVSKNGGHLSSNLGIVELTLSINKIFNIPPYKIIWDVGQQCYTHKLLTGRYKNFSTLREYGGYPGILPLRRMREIYSRQGMREQRYHLPQD